MLIADLPLMERPRERLSAHGPKALADRELLALLLGTGGSSGVGAHHLAERLLTRFGSIAAMSRAHPADLVGQAGVGLAKASAISAAFELGRRATHSPAAAVIGSTADLVPVVAPLLRGHPRERLALVVCDNANRVTSCEVISEGSAVRAMVPVREVAVAVLRRDGMAFALAHNHPSGELTPSTADIDSTAKVADASRALGLRFLDHLVVTDSGWCRIPFDAGPDQAAARPAAPDQAAPRSAARRSTPPVPTRLPGPVRF